MLMILNGESVFELCSLDLLSKVAPMLNLVCIPSGSGNELLKDNQHLLLNLLFVCLHLTRITMFISVIIFFSMPIDHVWITSCESHCSGHMNHKEAQEMGFLFFLFLIDGSKESHCRSLIKMVEYIK